MKQILTVILLLATVLTYAQDPGTLSKKEQRKLLKEERKRQEALAEAANAKLVKHMVESSTFILEADMLYDRYGKSYMVSSNINFVLCDSVYAVAQIGNDFSIGYNGVGGITLEGKVSDYEIDYNEKRNNWHISFTMRSQFGTYSVDMNVGASGTADATVSGMTNFGSIRYSGKLKHPAQSRVYKGSSF